MNDENKNLEFQQLCDAVFDGNATDEQIKQLEQLVLYSDELKQQYARMSHLHASLFLLSDQTGITNNTLLAQLQASTVDSGDSIAGPRSASTFQRVALAAMSLAVITLLSLLLLPANQTAPVEGFAQLITTKDTRWESSTFATDNLTRIGKGRLRISEGLVLIEFDNGMRIDVEGPADFELFDSERCKLHSGRLVAMIDSDLKGFIIETPNGILIDQGTSFGVNVVSDELTNLEVFDGQVDVEHFQSGAKTSLLESEAARITDSEIVHVDSPGELESIVDEKVVTRTLMQISTATGKSKDHWIQRNQAERKGSEDLLLLKSQPEFSSTGDFDRKIYLGFDLTQMANEEIDKASLQFTAVPTGMGFASFMPDATIAVYGLLDESLEDWESENLLWENAPGNSNINTEVDSDNTILVGTFVMKQGQQTGQFTITDQALQEFLKKDTNGLITFIAVCKTRPVDQQGLVLGFAGRNHASQPPPTLRFWLKE
ncbi:MAG: hypothetical protein ACKVH8_12580 [Pirellulales bacterium]